MPKRTKEEQKAAEEYHKLKCCTTKFMCIAIVLLFIGIVLLITAVGVFYAWDLQNWSGASFAESCYIRSTKEGGQSCTSEQCDPGDCTQSTYIVTPDDDDTCAVGECDTWDNGCTAYTFTGKCEPQPEYETGDRLPCYAYSDVDGQCNNAGKLDPDDEWSGQRTTYVVLLVFAIIFIVASIILFVIGCVRCLCKKVDDDILGETNGTGCYWCMDYERCCYGEGTGHATIVNQQGKNLPIKDEKRKKKTRDGGESTKSNKKKKDYNKQKSRDQDDEDYDEEAELR